MRLIATDEDYSVDCLCFCLFACLLVTFVSPAITDEHRSRCGLEGGDSHGPMEPYIEIPHGNGQFLGLSGQLKSIGSQLKSMGESLLRCTQQKGSFNLQ